MSDFRVTTLYVTCDTYTDDPQIEARWCPVTRTMTYRPDVGPLAIYANDES